jgi:hypothetical protein
MTRQQRRWALRKMGFLGITEDQPQMRRPARRRLAAQWAKALYAEYYKGVPSAAGPQDAIT